jgi:hypothetical protein
MTMTAQEQPIVKPGRAPKLAGAVVLAIVAGWLISQGARWLVYRQLTHAVGFPVGYAHGWLLPAVWSVVPLCVITAVAYLALTRQRLQRVAALVAGAASVAYLVGLAALADRAGADAKLCRLTATRKVLAALTAIDGPDCVRLAYTDPAADAPHGPVHLLRRSADRWTIIDEHGRIWVIPGAAVSGAVIVNRH